MDIVAWIRPWDGDDSDLGNMLAEPVIDGDTTPPADNHEWFACVLQQDALAAIEQARREAFEEAAKICEAISAPFGYQARSQCAAAIRARGEGK